MCAKDLNIILVLLCTYVPICRNTCRISIWSLWPKIGPIVNFPSKGIHRLRWLAFLTIYYGPNSALIWPFIMPLQTEFEALKRQNTVVIVSPKIPSLNSIQELHCCPMLYSLCCLLAIIMVAA